MSKYTTKFIPILSVIVVLSACTTTDKEVERLVHQRIATPQQVSNPYKNNFINTIQGNYTMQDGVNFNIDGTGFFKLGETEFFLHEVLNDNQAIYVAASAVPDSNKKVYTYHGIINTDTQLLSAPYKKPAFDNKKALTKKDTEYAWEVNVFQVENINWKSGFTTVFANKN